MILQKIQVAAMVNEIEVQVERFVGGIGELEGEIMEERSFRTRIGLSDCGDNLDPIYPYPSIFIDGYICIIIRV